MTPGALPSNLLQAILIVDEKGHGMGVESLHDLFQRFDIGPFLAASGFHIIYGLPGDFQFFGKLSYREAKAFPYSFDRAGVKNIRHRLIPSGAQIYRMPKFIYHAKNFVKKNLYLCKESDAFLKINSYRNKMPLSLLQGWVELSKAVEISSRDQPGDYFKQE